MHIVIGSSYTFEFSTSHYTPHFSTSPGAPSYPLTPHSPFLPYPSSSETPTNLALPFQAYHTHINSTNLNPTQHHIHQQPANHCTFPIKSLHFLHPSYQNLPLPPHLNLLTKPALSTPHPAHNYPFLQHPSPPHLYLIHPSLNQLANTLPIQQLTQPQPYPTPHLTPPYTIHTPTYTLF